MSKYLKLQRPVKMIYFSEILVRLHSYLAGEPGLRLPDCWLMLCPRHHASDLKIHLHEQQTVE